MNWSIDSQGYASNRSSPRLRLGKLTLALTLCVGFGSGLAAGGAVAACPNEGLRAGPSSQLPDCRAYELVTPGDSNGRRFGDVGTEYPPGPGFANEATSRFSDDSFLFSTRASALPDLAGGNGRNDGDVYQVVRTTSGWQLIRHVTPIGPEAVAPAMRGASFDHQYSFVFIPTHYTEAIRNGSLAEEGEAEYLGGPEGHFQLAGIGSLGVERLAQGRYISPGGGHVIFSTGPTKEGSAWCQRAVNAGRPCLVKELEPNAPQSGTGAVYDRPVDGPTHVVSLLPGNLTPGAGKNAAYEGASVDGATIAFEIESTLYVRVHNGEAASEETVKVAEGNPIYGGLSDDGTYLYYESGGDIHRFNTTNQANQPINSSGDAKMVNASTDGSHVYFVSPSQLDGSEGTVGDPNLYVWSGGSPSPHFIATVAQADTEGIPALTNWTSYAVAPIDEPGLGPGADSSRTTPDGSVLVFETKAELPGYDNAGHSEVVYRYDDSDKSLTCISCNPSGEAATAGAELEDSVILNKTTIIHNVSSDGERVFFETAEPLIEADVDTVNDVYEWEGGAGLKLISSGHSAVYPHLLGEISPSPNVLMGVTQDGNDVFFTSQESLALGAGVGGAPAIYDARVDGGFEQPAPPVVCLEEGCRPPVSPSPFLGGGAASANLQGSRNVAPKKKKKHHRRCHRRQRGNHRHCGQGRARVSAVDSAGYADGGASGAGNQSTIAAALTPNPITATAQVLSSEGEFEGEFGIKAATAEVSTTAAGQHPDFHTLIEFPTPKSEFAARIENIGFELPPGLYGNPNLVPRCSTGDFLGGECPTDSQVGVLRVKLYKFADAFATVPLFNMQPVHPDREIARFGALPALPPVYIDVSVRAASDYGVTAMVIGAPSPTFLLGAETIIWGDPADPSHNKQRMKIREGGECNGTACKAPGGERPPEELEPLAFMTNPAACGPWQVTANVTSYQLPGRLFRQSAPIGPGPVDQCTGQPFAPTLEARPTTDVASAPTGLKTRIMIPQGTDPNVPSTATMRETRITFPEGMTVNASAADGLAACSDEQVHFYQELDAQCPDASKLGTARLSSPALPRPLEGALYQRSPGGKGDQFRLWLVSDDLGLHVKIPGAVKPDPATGQLTAVFSDLPQVPVSAIEADIWGGARAPLKNPDTCGRYETTSVLAPWSSDPPATPSDRFQIDRGPGGGSCPTAPQDEPNSPGFEAGTTRPIAGAYSPFVLRLRREDGSQTFGTLDLTMPPGLIGRLAGLTECSDAAIAAAAAKSGVEEGAAPSCPDSSRIGTVWAAAGAGPHPFWTEGHAYLAGPYKGAPLSMAVITPATAGPFDLGTVVVRAALEVDPETAQITAKTDPLPRILEGIPLNLRTIAANIDRDSFIRNGTSCEPLAFSGSLFSTLGATAPLNERFQLGECGALQFKPQLTLRLKGSTKRSSNPALLADLTAKPGEANIARSQVTMPHPVFIDQAHIGTVCTRVQFAADRCPKRSVYGRAWARTPLLDYRLSGPVYLRSSDHPLPDLVAKLKGPAGHPLEFDLDGRIDSVHGALRSTFETVPDAPVRKFHFELFGGKRGLIELSDGLCRKSHVKINFKAHNGRVYDTRPKLKTDCGRKGKGKSRRGQRHG
jgi:hypothetical protein